jgi:hypothetical protein
MVKSICLSGTLTDVMRLNVLRILSLSPEDVDMNVGRMYRNNVHIVVQKRDSTSGVHMGFLDPLMSLSELRTIAAGVTDEDHTATLCFTPSIRLCDKYYAILRQELIECGAKETIFTQTKSALLSRWHSCTDKDVQQKLRQTFVMGVGDCKALIATTIASHGVDFKNLRRVIFLGFPSTIEEFWQIIGRAGRGSDGPVLVSVLWSESDFTPKRGREPNSAGLAFCKNEVDCRHEVGLRFFGQEKFAPLARCECYCCDICKAKGKLSRGDSKCSICNDLPHPLTFPSRSTANHMFAKIKPPISVIETFEEILRKNPVWDNLERTTYSTKFRKGLFTQAIASAKVGGTTIDIPHDLVWQFSHKEYLAASFVELAWCGEAKQ